jgi:hypothetical protein
MRTLAVFVLAALLAIDSSLPAGAVSPLRATLPGSSCGPRMDPVPQPGSQETTVTATITAINRKYGVLEAETEVGRVQVLIPPEAVQEVQVGDQFELCLADEAPSQNLLQDSVIT